MLLWNQRRIAFAGLGVLAMVWSWTSAGPGAAEPGRNPELRTAVFYVA